MGNRCNLPGDVVARLGDAGMAAVTATSGAHVVEARLWHDAELRVADSGDAVRVVGYASTFLQPYPIFGGAERGGFDEIIERGAFAKSLRERDDVRLLVNHDGVPLARTRSGTMRLEQDDYGLLVDAALDPGSPLVAGLRSAMERGDLDQMSFAFEVTRQSWNGDRSERRISEVKLFDVSIVTYPANPATMALIGGEPAATPVSTGRSVRLARADWTMR